MALSRALIAAVGLVLGCADGGTTGPGPGPGPTAITFSGVVEPMFQANCAFATGCHAGSSPQMGMDLSTDRSYGNTVNVAAVEVPTLFRIEPGNPDSSYLVLKIEGRAGLVGGVGTRMPLGGSLTQAQIDTIRAWVVDGAPAN